MDEVWSWTQLWRAEHLLIQRQVVGRFYCAPRPFGGVSASSCEEAACMLGKADRGMSLLESWEETSSHCG